MGAVVVAGIGLVLSGYGGILQSQATQDQLEQSREQDRIRIEEQAALFDSAIQLSKNKMSTALALSNYSLRSVRGVVVLTSDSDQARWAFKFPNVPPCTRWTLDMQDVKRARLSVLKDDWEPWLRTLDATAFKDWRGRPWRLDRDGTLKSDYVHKSPDRDDKRPGYRFAISGHDMLVLAKQQSLPDC
ncbi:hypothetical protein [Wenjunlia tyrosinilytica]|uniref:hypothetical protein n=1 Tax=Wenjunlia tyrosinilytica TaxID=1544741 RepID=UPI001665D56E|nr:hypothetical protein [Wenjunlia tyrosinilytica]